MTCGHCKRKIECRGGVEYAWQFEATATRYSGEFAARVDVFRPAAGVACSRACLQMLLVDAPEAWHPPKVDEAPSLDRGELEALFKERDEMIRRGPR